MGAEQETWSTADTMWDGGAATVLSLQRGITPNLDIFANNFAAGNTNAAVNTPFHHRALFNGAASAQQVDATTETTGDAGAANSGGITLGARLNVANWCNFSAGSFVLLSAAVDANYPAKMTALYNFSKNAYGTA